jgi:hypothetical protein
MTLKANTAWNIKKEKNTSKNICIYVQLAEKKGKGCAIHPNVINNVDFYKDKNNLNSVICRDKSIPKADYINSIDYLFQQVIMKLKAIIKFFGKT